MPPGPECCKDWESVRVPAGSGEGRKMRRRRWRERYDLPVFEERTEARLLLFLNDERWT